MGIATGPRVCSLAAVLAGACLGTFYNAGVPDAGRVAAASAAPVPGPELITNGSFSAGTTGWLEFATPNASFLVSTTAGGVYQFFRQPPPAGGPNNQATIFQETHVAVAAHTALTATFELGNTSSVRKRISVLVLDSDFSDLSVCTFFLDPGVPLRPYQMRTHSTRPWANAAIYFFAATTVSNGGFYTIDNVSLKEDTNGSPIRTDCVDPNVPASSGGGGGVINLLGNGDFGAGTLAPWGLFGQIVGQIVNGVFEFHRPAGTPAGTIQQPTGQALPAREIVTSTFLLGNSSAVRKRVTVIMHDLDFTDLAACTFFLAPGQPLSSYAMRMYTTKAWGNATYSVFAATVGLESAIRLDTVSMHRTPASVATGTECFEPTTPFAIALSPATLGISAQAQGTLTASISAPAGAGGVTVNLQSSNAGVATVPASVVIGAGQTTAPVTVTTGAASGGATITATATGLAGATAGINTTLRTMTLDATTLNLALGVPVNGTVTLAQPAPPAGVTVSLVSSDPNVSVTPSVAIGAGAVQGSFTVTATAAAASVTITGSAAGFTDATLDLTAGFRIWIADTSGFWDVAANWQGGQVPAAGDSVLINRPAAITVTIRTPTAALNTLQASEALTIDSTLTVNGTAFLDGGMTLNLNGSLAGAGTVQLRSAGTWTGGTIAAAGFVVDATRTLTMSGSNGKSWTNTQVVNNGSIVKTDPFGFTLIDSTVQNNGSFVQNGTFQLRGNSAATNAAGATWEIQGDLFFLQNGSGTGTQSFANQGTFRRTSGTGLAQAFGPMTLTNTGTIQVLTGTLKANFAWTTSGALSVTSGATIDLTNATLQAGTTITGGGALILSGTTVVPDLTLAQSTTLAGSLTGPGKLTMAAPLLWNVNSTITDSGLTIQAGQTFTTNSSGNQTLDNSPLVNNGTINWSGLSTLTLLNTTVQNNGTLTANGTLTFSGTSSVTNAAGGTWDARSNLVTATGSGTKTFTNHGQFRRTTSASILVVNAGVNFVNTGTIDVQTGGFRVNTAGWTTSGALIVAKTATLILNGATLQNGTTISGTGELEMGSTTIQPDLTLNLTTTLTGSLTGPGDLTIAAPFIWSQAGTISGVDLHVTASEMLTISSTGNRILLNSHLENDGTVNWSGTATLTLSSSDVTNNGTVVSSGTLTFDGPSQVFNASGATWEVKASQMTASGVAGTKSFVNHGLFRRGGTIGIFTVASAIQFTNFDGTIELRLGGLSAGQFDSLALGQLTIAGSSALDIRLANGFVPASGDDFNVLTYTFRSGTTFATILGNGQVYTASHGSQILTITKQ